jgi:hypothetical protein
MSLSATPVTVAKRNYAKCDRCTRLAVHFTKNAQLCDKHRQRTQPKGKGK